MYQACLSACLVNYQLSETDHSVAEKRPDVDAAVQKRPRVLMHPFKAHPVVRKAFSLADDTLVVYLANSSNEGVSEGYFAGRDSLFLRFSGHISSFVVDLLCPPSLETRHWQDSQVVPLHLISVFRRAL